MSHFVFTDNNVYILGTGFSVDAGLPVVASFINVMRDSLAWLIEKNRKREAEAVEKVLRFRVRAASASYRVHLNVENIEELFSLASASINTGGVDVALAISATLDYAKACREDVAKYGASQYPSVSWSSQQPPTDEALATYIQGNKRRLSRPLYDVYLGWMSSFFCDRPNTRHDAIISFNYDTIAEDALSRLGMPFSYGKTLDPELHPSAGCSKDEDAIPVLKLHGSVNWSLVANSRINIYGEYSKVLQTDADPLLIPPTWRKSFTKSLSTVWDEAVGLIRDATRIIVIGYSIPPIDFHFKYLLAAG